MKLAYRGLAVLLLASIAGISAYAAWYEYDRARKIAHNDECGRITSQPASISDLPPCAYELIPPTLREKATGYGGPKLPEGCDQSATTTDCSTFPPPSQTEPQPYVPPDPAQPAATWVSATDTPIRFAGFSFELPAGWHGSVYNGPYLQNTYALVQSESNDQGFTIDCPPAGKGFETAIRLSSKTRAFIHDETEYSIAFEKWTAPGNDPWYFLWIRMPEFGDSSGDTPGTYCLAQGSAVPDIEEAMRVMYATWQ